MECRYVKMGMECVRVILLLTMDMWATYGVCTCGSGMEYVNVVVFEVCLCGLGMLYR